jgi:multidrug efflux pump subunit AcrA (membrane-fusion protein)
LARFEHAQEQLKYREAEAQIKRMRIRSPIAGKVEQVAVKEGEASDAVAVVIRVVCIDPLWMDVPVELAVARGLSVGSATQVDFAACTLADGTTSAPAMSVEGRITYIGAVAEAASNTLLVRVEAPNPSGRPAGERVDVTFRRGAGGPSAAKPSPAATSQPHSPSADTNNKKE